MATLNKDVHAGLTYIMLNFRDGLAKLGFAYFTSNQIAWYKDVVAKCQLKTSNTLSFETV